MIVKEKPELKKPQVSLTADISAQCTWLKEDINSGLAYD
jgi:hypothetical protein